MTGGNPAGGDATMDPAVSDASGLREAGSRRAADRGAFEAARAEGRAALMPYMMAGFPDRESSLAIAAAYADGGADLIELGVPFSDPLADGPTIHAAATAALREGATLGTALEVCESVSDRVPVVLMVYANMVLAQGGAAEFARRAAAAGAAGAIVPDLPLDEAAELREAFAAAGLALVPLVAPTTHRAPRPDLRRRRGLRLRRLHRRHDGRARGDSRRPRRPGRRGQGRVGGARRGRLRDRHARAGRPGRRDGRRRDRRQPPGARRRRGGIGRDAAAEAVAAFLPRHASPSPGRITAAWDWWSRFFLALAAMTVSYAFGQGGPVAGLVFFAVLLIGAAIRVFQPELLTPLGARRHYLQVFGLQHEGPVAGGVALLEEGAQVRRERLLALWPDPFEGDLGGAEVGAEEVQPMVGGAERLARGVALDPQLGDPVAEQLAKALLGPPEQRGAAPRAGAARVWRPS